jgi:diguanylate cyclase (GGDEF)-like protein
MASVPIQVELLSESLRTRVVRLHMPDGRSLIRKEALGPGGEERVRHEVAILRRLSGIAHIVQLESQQPDPGSILLEDVHGAPLAQLTTPVSDSRIVSLMLDLGRAVAAIHQHGVVHCDINPGNILLAESDTPVYLIDFALATTIAEFRPDFSHPKEIVGTLPYLAPEQTGRTGRSVDRRADLYGLGATMYELATGQPPFGTGDPLRIIHDHLARSAVPPATVNPELPSVLSDIIMHLLEKEPDNRYQTAEALIHDLERVRDGAQQLRVGEIDVPARLAMPSRLVGRDKEIDLLRSAFEGAVAGESRGLLISGKSGAGKSALAEELRPIATAGDGWFTLGKFDRYSRDPGHDGVGQALAGLARLLLAQPEDEIAEIRQRLLQALGPNAGIPAEVVPEFATLLKVQPERGDPLTAQERARRTALEILRAVASRARPVVFVIDDVQWAGETPLGFIDRLLTGEEEVEGLLTVAVYREGEVSEADPLAPRLERWLRQPDRPEHLRVANLDQASLAAMIGEMLHMPSESVADLAGSTFALTEGNPFETVQLLNGLRRDGVLRPTGAGWSWDPEALEQRLTSQNLAELTKARVESMPDVTRETLEAMACLGGEVRLHALEVATGLSEDEVQQRLAPALEDGLVLMVAELRKARFQHDQFRDAVLIGIPPQRLGALRLRMARRLAAQPDLSTAAASQYLNVVDALHDPQERHRAATLLSQAAGQSMWIGESLPAERMLAAAVRLTDDPATLVELHTARLTALVRLGRLVEADEIYQTVIGLSSGVYDRVEATRVQISSLTTRNRNADAIELGLELLRQLGWVTPAADKINIEIEDGLDWCRRWIEETTEQEDLGRPDVTDATVLAAGTLISRIMPACFFSDHIKMAWLAIAATRTWAETGPARTLVGALSHLPWAFVERRQDYRTGYRLMRRLLAVGEERDFEPDLSEARFLYAGGFCQWFHPLEEDASEARRAREGLIRGGDLWNAGYSYLATVYAIDRYTTLNDYVAEVEDSLAFCARTGQEDAAGGFRPYRWLVAVLRGEPDTADWAKLAGEIGGNPVAAANVNIARALAAAIFDDPASLDQHSAAAMSLRPGIEATYDIWQASLLRAIALADRLRAGPDNTADFTELDEIVDWMSQRTADMPTNFRHMLRLVEAERAWAARDLSTAMQAFNSALRDADHRPWHHAYIAERWAKFLLANGFDRFGWPTLVEARETYQTWGALAKVNHIDRAYPSLEIPTGNIARRASITAGAIDMMGVLNASRALSSETSLGALRAKVVEVVSAMTGATDVGLFLWDANQRQWLAPDDGDRLVPITDWRREPQFVIRYVERTREPLIVADATRDDRFARDPYFQDMRVCSVLAVPVLSRDTLQAILVLENRLISDAFTAERLEGVMLISGQLAISLDNALIYASLEQKVAERTQQLEAANDQLAQLSVTDPLTGLANRRRLDEALNAEWARATRTQGPLSLIMLDIDHFKRYNDTHGHQAGDRCLQRVANELNRTVRDTDLAARFGGEEFAVVMPDTASDTATEAAERIRIAIADLGQQLTDDQLVTVSAGVATIYNAEQQRTDQLIESADAALYQAKGTGRNRVCVGAAPNFAQTTSPGRRSSSS